MGYAYTPGLTVAEHTEVRRIRRLPLRGDVLVQVGQEVSADTAVARTELPGEVRAINVVGQLGIAAEELPELMLKRDGEPVAANEPFVRTRGLFGFFKGELCSPIDGTVEQISSVTGQVLIRGRPVPLQRSAFAAGRVVDVEPGESATIEIRGTVVQGTFGIGGEVAGPIEMAVQAPDEVLDSTCVRGEWKGRVLVGGSLLTAAAVRRAAEVGVEAIITGGLDDADLRDFLGYEIGVAITGEESLGVTLVVTEGFGRIRMAQATFELLRRRAGLLASVNGATQIRAGVLRPEVLIPLDGTRPEAPHRGSGSTLAIGAAVRAIREPYFGRLGRCVGLPAELMKLPSEARVRVLEVEFDDGTRATVPRANVELITS